MFISQLVFGRVREGAFDTKASSRNYSFFLSHPLDIKRIQNQGAGIGDGWDFAAAQHLAQQIAQRRALSGAGRDGNAAGLSGEPVQKLILAAAAHNA